MFVSIVIDDGQGGGHALGEWLQQNGCPCTLVGDYQSAFAAIKDQQLAGASLILMFAPVAGPSLEFVTSVHDAYPALINGLYTRSPVRDQDASLIADHGLVAVLHHPFTAESPAVIGLGHLPPIAAPIAQPQPRAAQPMPDAPANRVGLTESFASDPRSSLWIITLEDQPGCCADLVASLDARGVTVRIMTSWREAADMAVHALTPGLIIGPIGDDAKRTGRSLARSASQLVLYSDLPSHVRDTALRDSYGCLAIIKKPFVINELKSIVEWMRAPGWQPPLRDSTTRSHGTGSQPHQIQTLSKAPPAVTNRLAALRTPPPGSAPPANHQPLQPQQPTGTAPLTGLAALRARKQSEVVPPTGATVRQDVRSVGGTVKRQHVVQCESCGADVLALADRSTALCARCSGQPL